MIASHRGGDGKGEAGIVATATHSAEDVRRQQRRQAWIRRLPLLPALLFTIVVTQVPFVFSLWYSLTEWTIVPPSDREFIGVDNYTDLLTDDFFGAAVDLVLSPKLIATTVIVTGLAVLVNRRYFGQDLRRTLLLSVFLISPIVGSVVFSLDTVKDGFSSLFNTFFAEAAWTSIVMTVSAVLLSLVIGTGLALLLDRQFFGRGLARTLLITPFLIMPVVAGQIWTSQIYNSSFGVLNWLLDTVGFERIEFVSRFPLWSIVTVLVWQWSPFMMLIVLAGLQGQDTSILEAARVDGATSRSIFFQITLPHLRPFLELGILLGAIYLIQVFDHVEVITGGGPGSTNIPYFVFQRSIGGGWRFGEASAYSIVVVIASIVLATLGLRVLSNLLEGEDPA